MAAAAFLVGLKPLDAGFGEERRGVAGQFQRFQQRDEFDPARRRDIRLPGLRRHAYRPVVCTDLMGDLDDELAYMEGVRVREAGAEPQFPDAALRAGRQQQAVAGDLAAGRRRVADERGQGHGAVGILHPVEGVGIPAHGEPGDAGQVAVDALHEAGLHADPRAHGGGAEDARGGTFAECRDLGSGALKQGRVPGQALSEGERHRVLKARPADADHGAEGFHALPDCRLQRGEGVQQAAGFAVQDKGGRRGKHVVGGLAHIDVGIGMDAIRALVPGQQLVGAVPQHLVDVHVDGCPAASEHVDRELIGVASGEHFVARRGDGVRNVGGQRSDFLVGQGTGLLDFGHCLDDVGVVRERVVGNGEVFHRPQGLYAVVGLIGEQALPKAVLFFSHGSPRRRFQQVCVCGPRFAMQRCTAYPKRPSPAPIPSVR